MVSAYVGPPKYTVGYASLVLELAKEIDYKRLNRFYFIQLKCKIKLEKLSLSFAIGLKQL